LRAGKQVPGPIDFYNGAAASLARRYDSIAFAAVHRGLLAHLPSPPALILDVGAGSGRDARALAALGYHVIAVEPAAGLRTLGQQASPGVDWLDDRLPDLRLLHTRTERFDFILCSAVLMSLAPSEIEPSLGAMASLLVPGGKLSVSLRDPRAGEGILHRHDIEHILAGAAKVGLDLLEANAAADQLGRGLSWRSYLFRKPVAHFAAGAVPDAG
jgi:SAM-dependent methyltransferase